MKMTNEQIILEGWMYAKHGLDEAHNPYTFQTNSDSRYLWRRGWDNFHHETSHLHVWEYKFWKYWFTQ